MLKQNIYIQELPDALDAPEQQYSMLVVDDNEMNRDLLSRRLQRQGYNVCIAENGQKAIDIISQKPFDLVLLDIMMPEVNGYQVLEYMKSDVRLRHIPVIMISALDELESVVRCVELGADDYITKPFNPVLLRARIGACLEKKRLHDHEEQYRQKIEEHNQHLEEQVRKQVKEITTAQLAAIFAMSKLAESRDPETGEHLERMREYSKVLAQTLTIRPRYRTVIDQKFIDNIYAASPLHDIGKVGVPDHILCKPGKLTPEEWEAMKTHTLIGASTLLEVDRQHPGNDLIRMGVQIAGGHHEKWNGSGYPNGLAGEEIPLVARILALGDVYDALTSKRCYKEAFSHEKSRDIIIADSGTHFDPDVVGAFLEAEEEFRRIRAYYQDPEED
jgi:putative two-component system response regulator